MEASGGARTRGNRLYTGRARARGLAAPDSPPQETPGDVHTRRAPCPPSLLELRAARALIVYEARAAMMMMMTMMLVAVLWRVGRGSVGLALPLVRLGCGRSGGLSYWTGILHECGLS